MDAVNKFIQMLKTSAIMRQQVYQLLFAVLTLIGAKVDLPGIQENGEAIVDGVLTTLSAVVAGWTMFTRATKPSPNLTATADRKEAELVASGKLAPADATAKVAAAVAPNGVKVT